MDHPLEYIIGRNPPNPIRIIKAPTVLELFLDWKILATRVHDLLPTLVGFAPCTLCSVTRNPKY